MSWYVSEPVRSGWSLDPNVFVTHLRAKWPNAEIKEIPKPGRKHFTHEWKIHMPDSILEGRFNSGLSGVVLDCELEDAAAFAVWFRSLAPSHVNLLFYDEESSTEVDVRPGMTARDVVIAVAAHK